MKLLGFKKNYAIRPQYHQTNFHCSDFVVLLYWLFCFELMLLFRILSSSLLMAFELHTNVFLAFGLTHSISLIRRNPLLESCAHSSSLLL
mmetsp:Transcript_26837/g.55691  ORF Transcript_26837/g.55691 Transcript_26837/m.55691 type:complete len:90 (-) Transcript_26837:454-723(-)